MNAIHINPDQAQSIIRATFPGYTGKMVQIRPADSVTFSDLNWSGGSRSEYRACTLDGSPVTSRTDINAPAPWENPFEGKTATIPAGHAIVEHCIFCGKDLGLRIYARAQDVAPMLPAPVSLTPFEALVLKYTCERKASYNGKNRYAMARDDNEFSARFGRETLAAFPTADEWESAKQTLIARGFLNKAGAVTIAGRNAHQK